MAGIRGVRNPIPSKGSKPTGIFSTNGKQKMDPVGSKFPMQDKTGNKGDMPRKGPVARDNGQK